MGLERVVILDHNGERFTFRQERKTNQAFWTVEWNGQIYRSHHIVYGNEEPDWFRELADRALRSLR